MSSTTRGPVARASTTPQRPAAVARHTDVESVLICVRLTRALRAHRAVAAAERRRRPSRARLGREHSDSDPGSQAGAAEDLCRHEGTDCAPSDRGDVGCGELGCLGVCQTRVFRVHGRVIHTAPKARVCRLGCLERLLNSFQAAPVSMGRPASFHSRMPSAARRAVIPWLLNRRTASWASTQ